jgi:Ras-related protein Rab-1A
MSEPLIYNVCILASKGVSKEAIVGNFVNRILKGEYKITFRVDLPLKSVEEKMKLQFWIFPYDYLTELVNWDEFAYLQIRESNGIIIMYDITDEETMKWAIERIQMIRKVIDRIPAILLVGNKLKSDKDREVSEEQITQLKHECEINSSMEISLETGKNVEKAFIELTRMMLKNSAPDCGIGVKKIAFPKGNKYYSLLVALLIYGVSVITSIILYFIITA